MFHQSIKQGNEQEEEEEAIYRLSRFSVAPSMVHLMCTQFDE